MPYTPQTWTNDVSKLNATRMTYIEDGIDDAHDTADAAIPKPVGPSTNEVLIWNGTSWDAESITNAHVSSGAAIAVTKLAGGTDNQFLRMDGSTIQWETVNFSSNVSRQTNNTAVGTGANTAETDLQTITISAAALTTGDVVRILSMGTSAGSAGSRTIKLYFGSTQIAQCGAVGGGANAEDWHFYGEVVVTGASAQESFIMKTYWSDATGTGTRSGGIEIFTPAEAVSGSIVVKVTGQTSSSADELTSEYMSVHIFKA